MNSSSLGHLLALLAVIVLIAGLVWRIVSVSRRTRAVTHATGLVGFGGWLALLALSQTLSPVVTLLALPQLLAQPHRSRSDTFAAILIIALALIQTFVTIAMWRKRRYFRKAFVIQSAVMLLFLALALLGAAMRPDPSSDSAVPPAIVSFVGIFAWMLYVLRSVRVRNTFRRGGPEDPEKTVEAF